jgi:CSLREA domain-containing protein
MVRVGNVTRLARLGGAVGLLSVLLAPSVWAASFTVTTTADAADATPGDGVCATAIGECTLRAAIQEGNALAGADTVTLPAGRYRLIGGTLQIDDDLSLASTGVAVIDGNRQVRVLKVAGQAHVTMTNVRIQRGAAESGGGLWNDGSVILSSVALKGNRATGIPGGFGLGAGIYNAGTLELSNVSFSSNIAGGRDGSFGGGVYNVGTATLTSVSFTSNRTNGCGGGVYNANQAVVIDASFSRNRASNAGGAFFNDVASATLSRVTMSANRATQIGGGLFNYGNVDLTNATITGNRAANGGGVFSSYGQVSLTNVTVNANRAAYAGGLYHHPVTAQASMTLVNTIIAGNKPQNCASEPVTSLGHNLDSGTSCALSGLGDLSQTDPMLGPLRNNGGVGRTRALLAGSPAIDAADAASCPATDQCGAARPADGNGDGIAVCDIGAYEAPH